MAIWDVMRQVWRVPHGHFTFRAGSSSRRLPLELDVKVDRDR